MARAEAVWRAVVAAAVVAVVVFGRAVSSAEPLGAVAAPDAVPSVARTVAGLELTWDNTALLSLPIDRRGDGSSAVVRQVHGAAYATVQPTPRERPYLMGVDGHAARAIGLHTLGHLAAASDLGASPSSVEEALIEFLCGNTIANGSVPLAHAYGGHQFGYWSGQLGDGRALTLGAARAAPECEASEPTRHRASAWGDAYRHRPHLVGPLAHAHPARWELALKGSGITPFSRDGDGMAVQRSSIREFLMSAAMRANGVPTSHAVSIVGSPERARRDQWYQGEFKLEPVAVVLRLAPSWLRIGSFELPFKRGDTALLTRLADYAIHEHWPHLESGRESDARYARVLQEVVVANAVLVAHWQAVGFAHGVLNTDNVSILGITIDFGPFGMLDAFDPLYVPNTSDDEERYSFRKQPAVMRWNMERFAEAMAALVPDAKGRAAALELFAPVYRSMHGCLMARRLGLRRTATGAFATNSSLGFACVSVEECTQEAVREANVLITERHASHPRDSKTTGRACAGDLDDAEVLSVIGTGAPAARVRNVLGDAGLLGDLAAESIVAELLSLLADARADYNAALRALASVQWQSQCVSAACTADEVMSLASEFVDVVMSGPGAPPDGRDYFGDGDYGATGTHDAASVASREQQVTEWLRRYIATTQETWGAASSSAATSHPVQEVVLQRRRCMDAANPRYVLRQHVCHQAIEASTSQADLEPGERDFSELHTVHELVRRPFVLRDGLGALCAGDEGASSEHTVGGCASDASSVSMPLRGRACSYGAAPGAILAESPNDAAARELYWETPPPWAGRRGIRTLS